MYIYSKGTYQSDNSALPEKIKIKNALVSLFIVSPIFWDIKIIKKKSFTVSQSISKGFGAIREKENS